MLRAENAMKNKLNGLKDEPRYDHEHRKIVQAIVERIELYWDQVGHYSLEDHCDRTFMTLVDPVLSAFSEQS